MSIDGSTRRPMSTIVELSPDQANTSTEELDFDRELTKMSLTPLAQGERLFTT